MKKTTYMVVINVDYDDARKVCEQIENTTFQSVDKLFQELQKIDSEIIEHVGISTISDFMDAVNNQEMDNLTNSFISYVIIGE